MQRERERHKKGKETDRYEKLISKEAERQTERERERDRQTDIRSIYEKRMAKEAERQREI